MDRIRILFVDDEAIVREGLKKCIDWEVNGFEVVGAAENGEKALEYLRQLSVNIVVTDIKMPVMDGLELIRNSRESGYDSKFLILSGYDDFQYAQRALRYGADDYILKPIKEEELLDALIRIRDLHFPKQQTTLQLHPQKYSGTVKTIISCVEMNLDQPELSLKQIADEVLFMSGNYLSKLFLKETGYKFSTFLTRRSCFGKIVMLRFMKLLKERGLGIIHSILVRYLKNILGNLLRNYERNVYNYKL